MPIDTERRRGRKRVKLPNGEEVQVPVITDISFVDPRQRYQETRYAVDNSLEADREVHVDDVYHVDVDQDGKPTSETPTASGQPIKVERVDVWKVLDPRQRYQETHSEFDNRTGSDLLPPSFTEHKKTHIYRYYRDPENPDDDGAWIDSELIDEFADVDRRDRYWETSAVLTNPTNAEFRDGDLSGQANQDDPDITNADGGEGTADNPLRLDPFQNVVNFNQSSSPVLNFVYCAHNADGGIMTYTEDVKLGYTLGNPGKYPDQTPPAQTEYNRLVDIYMENRYGRGYCVKANADYNSQYGLPNIPLDVTAPGRLYLGAWTMSLDIDPPTGDALRDEAGKLLGGATEDFPFVAVGSVNFKVKGFPLGEDWQVPIHWEGPGGTEPNGGCHLAWCSAGWSWQHRWKQLFDDWTTADGTPGPDASELNSFSINFSGISYTADGITYEAIGMRARRNTGYPGSNFRWIYDATQLSDPFLGYDYHGSKYDENWNVIGIEDSIGFINFQGAEQTVQVLFARTTA